jgi:3-dehydro-4-phosphotetronate decarboxylase
MLEANLRAELHRLAKSLFDRGFSVGSAGNISVALKDGWLVTPTNSCLGFLSPESISKVDRDWRHVSGEELEETVKLLVVLRSKTCRMLTPAQVEELQTTFG